MSIAQACQVNEKQVNENFLQILDLGSNGIKPSRKLWWEVFMAHNLYCKVLLVSKWCVTAIKVCWVGKGRAGCMVWQKIGLTLILSTRNHFGTSQWKKEIGIEGICDQAGIRLLFSCFKQLELKIFLKFYIKMFFLKNCPYFWTSIRVVHIWIFFVTL